MPGRHTLLLALLVLLVELLPALTRHHHAGDQATAAVVTPAPRRAPRGRRPPAVLPAPGKAGECPAGASGAPRPARLYCLSDHHCPGAEKCCQSGRARTCLLPTTGTAAPPKRCQRGDWRRVGGGQQPVPASVLLARGHTEHLPRREPGLLPPRRHRHRGELRDELPQRHGVWRWGEVLHPRLLHPLPARPAR